MIRKLVAVLIILLSGFGIYALHNYLVMSRISDIRIGGLFSFGIYFLSGLVLSLIKKRSETLTNLIVSLFILEAIFWDSTAGYVNHLNFPVIFPVNTLVKIIGFYLGFNVLKRTWIFYIGLLISIPILLYINMIFIPNTEYKKQADIFIPKQKHVNYSLLQTQSGDTIDRSFFKGKVVLLDFYFMNCRPCREKFPTLEKLKSTFSNRNDVEIIGVYCDVDQTLDKLPTFLEHYKITLPTYIDKDLELRKELGITSMPVDIVLNKKGEIVSTYWGFQMGASDKYFDERVKLINGLLKTK